jgi:hypothetical protein
MAKPKQSAARRPRGAAAAAGTAKPAAGRPAPAKAAPAKSGPGKTGPARTDAARPAAGSGTRKAGARVVPPRPLATVTAPVPLPRSAQIAVWLMYAGAVLSVLVLVATLATIGSVRGELHRAYPGWSPALLTTQVHSLILRQVVSWAVTIAVWLIMARTNQAGRAWARNVATVLAALGTLSFLYYLHTPGSLIGKLLLAPMWLVGVAAAALLWRRESTAYIRAGAV